MDDDFTPVHLKLIDTSDCNFRYDIVTEVPHLSDWQPGGLVIAPKHMLLRFTPDTNGAWHLYMLLVFGMPVRDGKVKERKRLDKILFMSPLDEAGSSRMPTWLREIAEHHVALMNPEVLKDRQQEAARKAAREMFSLASEDMADEMADTILTAVLRVG